MKGSEFVERRKAYKASKYQKKYNLDEPVGKCLKSRFSAPSNVQLTREWAASAEDFNQNESVKLWHGKRAERENSILDMMSRNNNRGDNIKFPFTLKTMTQRKLLLASVAIHLSEILSVSISIDKKPKQMFEDIMLKDIIIIPPHEPTL